MSYSVQAESSKILSEGLLGNQLIGHDLPPEVEKLMSLVKFTGSARPLIPIVWRFPESIASLKALEALLLGALISRKYGERLSSITINT